MHERSSVTFKQNLKNKRMNQLDQKPAFKAAYHLIEVLGQLPLNGKVLNVAKFANLLPKEAYVCSALRLDLTPEKTFMCMSGTACQANRSNQTKKMNWFLPLMMPDAPVMRPLSARWRLVAMPRRRPPTREGPGEKSPEMRTIATGPRAHFPFFFWISTGASFLPRSKLRGDLEYNERLSCC